MIQLGHRKFRNTNIRRCFKYLWESKNLHITLQAEGYLPIWLTTLNTKSCKNYGVRLQLKAGGKWTQTSERVRRQTYKHLWSAGATWQLVRSKIPRTRHLDRKCFITLNNVCPLIYSNKWIDGIQRIPMAANILQSKQVSS